MTDQRHHGVRDSVSAQDLARSYSSHQPTGRGYHSVNRWVTRLLAEVNAISFFLIIGFFALIGVYLGPVLIPGSELSDAVKMSMGGPLGAAIGFVLAIYYCGLMAMLFTFLHDIERIAISSELRARQ